MRRENVVQSEDQMAPVVVRDVSGSGPTMAAPDAGSEPSPRHCRPPGIPDADYSPAPSFPTIPWQARANRWFREHLQPGRIEANHDRCITASMVAMATGCRIVAVVGPKGGVGKTTVALTAGRVLAEVPLARPILVELNPDWGTVDTTVGDANPRTMQDLLHHLTAVDRTGIGLLQGFVTMWGRLPVLTAPRFPGEMARLSPQDIARVLRVLAVHYNVIILDCGTSFTGQLTQCALQVADHVIMVTTPDRVAVQKTLAVADYLASDWYARDYGPVRSDHAPNAIGVRTRVLTELTLVVNGVGPLSASDPLDVHRLGAALPGLNAVITLPHSAPLRYLPTNGTFSFDMVPADYRRALKSLLVATLGRLAPP